MTPPRDGQIYELNGRQRQVVEVRDTGGGGYDVYWKRPGSEKVQVCFMWTWQEWVKRAKLVENG